MSHIITSQHYLDANIVSAKRAAHEFLVSLSPEFEFEGETYQVVLDGHHSLAAALLDGEEPEYVTLQPAQHDAIEWLERGDARAFLEIMCMDGDYIDAITRDAIW